jgi:hypothetical protein
MNSSLAKKEAVSKQMASFIFESASFDFNFEYYLLILNNCV